MDVAVNAQSDKSGMLRGLLFTMDASTIEAPTSTFNRSLAGKILQAWARNQCQFIQNNSYPSRWELLQKRLKKTKDPLEYTAIVLKELAATYTRLLMQHPQNFSEIYQKIPVSLRPLVDQALQDDALMKAWPKLREAIRENDSPAPHATVQDIRAWLDLNKETLQKCNDIDLSNLNLFVVPKEIRLFKKLRDRKGISWALT